MARKTANRTADKRDAFDAKYDGRAEKEAKEEAGQPGHVRDTLHCPIVSRRECLASSRRRAVLARELHAAVFAARQVGRDVLISKLVGIVLDDTFIFASITRWKSL